MYKKELYLYIGDRPVKAVVRNYKTNDFKALIEIQKESFPPPFPSDLWWNEEQLKNHVALFQNGALCVEIDGVIAGSMTGLLISFDPAHPEHTWEEVTDSGYIRNHENSGNTLYVVDICVRPSYRKFNLGKLLMQSMYEVVIHLGVDRLIGGGRMPGYQRHAEKMSPQEYVQSVMAGDLYDPVISFLLRSGRTPVAVVSNYIEDAESQNNALLMEWKNPFK
ncbi:GNAT family N-acetyltransferase [Fictibacillus barbaricus]|uniref:Ribosomal protein S18 acetylase RimI-like enzyme n=1 Tax=Fictibacillus barbaricus TaxID=182136 RepID=A0ABU1U323_9BACL|nr:GNAT family N-acetyltransferase [Fictibacillus barbaricus]MDR7073786.1 ribosomal protein S18 acetylase RimI-like enzyme [Fictibacillus barbaricus]